MVSEIYDDIAVRTGGDIYIGVVGPVRTGKSSFIKRFMELMVIPNIENRYKRDRAVDELPQSGSGKSIMTCEPKFVPNEAVSVNVGGNAKLNIRLIDCVGYMVKNALGAYEDGTPRMIRTPWTKDPMPFEKAAEIGTKKVIEEHSTIGIVVTTDGSISELEREDYVEGEERVVSELKAINKPFVILLNTRFPNDEKTKALKNELEAKYQIPVVVADVLQMSLEMITEIISKILYEFPVRDIMFRIPKWLGNLSDGHWLPKQITDYIHSSVGCGDKVRNVISSCSNVEGQNFKIDVANLDLSEGNITCEMHIGSDVFYKIISEENGVEIKTESELFTVLTSLLKEKGKVDAFTSARDEAARSGYGIVYPDFTLLDLKEPEIFSDSGRYGITLKAEAKALHMIESGIESEISPVIGSEAECEMFYSKLMELYDKNRQELWNTEIFGRKLADMMADNIRTKLGSISEDTKGRLTKAIRRISNTQKGGLLIMWL